MLTPCKLAKRQFTIFTMLFINNFSMVDFVQTTFTKQNP